MADNTQLNPGSGGDVIRTIQRPTSKTQVLQVDIGGEAGEQLVVGSMPVSGTVAVSSVSGTVTTTGTSTVTGTVSVSSIAAAVTANATIVPPAVQSVRVNYTGAQTDTQLVNPGGSLRVYVTRLSISIDNAVTVNVSIRIGTGTTTTPTGAGCIWSHPGLAANASVTVGDGQGVLGSSLTLGDSLRVTITAPTGGSLDLVYEYYTAP